jgi:hypothetical protein
MRYRSKPTEIEAYQLTKELIAAHVLDKVPLPGVRMMGSNRHPERREVWSTRQCVTTIQGQRVYVEPGEWIVREPDCVHYYPIADDVFHRKYEPIESQEGEK